jgi:DNA-binding ferritin-like protein
MRSFYDTLQRFRSTSITIEQFRERIQFTKKNNDFGTEDVLKDMIEDHEEIAQPYFNKIYAIYRKYPPHYNI